MSNLVTVNFQLLPQVRRETHGGIEYVIAPVVAVRAGVLNGELLPAEEIAKSVAAWNGVPLPISHPRENGTPISVNREDLLAACIGTFQHAHFDGFSLRGELWLDAAKARAQGGDALVALQRLERNEPLEVSTAYEPCPVEPIHGDFYGQPYTGIQRNIRPDHLALLPNETGACSWEHGCGAPRVNQQKVSPVKNFFAAMKARLLGQVSANITQSFDDVRKALWDALNEVEVVPTSSNSMYAPYCYIEDVYKDRVIYGIESNGQKELYERSYTLDKDGQATLGDRSAVVKEVRYLPATTPATNTNKGELPLDLSPAPGPTEEPAAGAPPLSPNAHKANCDCSVCEQHVNQEVHMDKKELVSNVLKAQGLDESQRAHFEALPDAVLQKLAVKAEPTPAPKPEPAPVMPAFTTEQLQSALAAVMPKPDPDVVFIQNQHKAQADTLRREWSTFIAANSAYTAEDCAAKTIGDLQKLYQTLQATAQHANYGGRAFPQMTANADEDTVPDPPAIMLAPVTPVSH